MRTKIVIFLYGLICPIKTLCLTPKTNRYERGKKLADMAKKKLKEKSASISSVISLPESISLTRTLQDGKDFIKESFSGRSLDAEKLSISLLIADLKEKTGDISQMVRHRSNHIMVRNSILLSTIEIRGGGTPRLSGSGIATTNHHRHDGGDQLYDGAAIDAPIWTDEIGRKICQSLGIIVGLQTLGTILSRNNFEVFDEIASRLLSEESANAVKNIRQIIENFPDHGVKDVFSLYPTKDVVASILALSRLQSVLYYVNNRVDTNTNNGSVMDFLTAALSSSTNYSVTNADDGMCNERELLEELAHYSAFAHAAYGWKMGLLSGKVHFGDRAMLLRKTGLKRRHLIKANRKSKTHLPAYFIARDVKRRKIVLCIRGTLSPKDILTDLCCTAEDFITYEDETKYTSNSNDTRSEWFRTEYRARYRARAHQGMLEAARGVAKMTHRVISSELASKPDYDLVIVGHSLGGGVAAILGTFWKDTFPGLKVYGYGSPCVGPIDSYPTISDSIVSVVGEGDPFSCLSLGHLADASSMLSKLCEDKDLREDILNNTRLNVDEMDEAELKWCVKKMKTLTAEMNAEKFYPPGRVLQMKGSLFGNVDEVRLSEVSQESAFRDLRFHPRMFDLSLHIPHRYEVLLSRIWTNAKKRQNDVNASDI